MFKINSLIEIDYTLNDERHLDFFNLCFFNSKEINDFKSNVDVFNSTEEIYHYFGEYPYIVYSDCKPVGFIFPCRDKISNALGMSIWIPSLSYLDCKFNSNYEVMNVMIYSGMLLDYHLYITKGPFYKYIEFDTASNYICKMVTSMLPGIKNTKIRKNYILMYEEFSNLDLSKIELLYSSGFSVGFSFLSFDFRKNKNYGD